MKSFWMCHLFNKVKITLPAQCEFFQYLRRRQRGWEFIRLTTPIGRVPSPLSRIELRSPSAQAKNCFRARFTNDAWQTHLKYSQGNLKPRQLRKLCKGTDAALVRSASTRRKRTRPRHTYPSRPFPARKFMPLVGIVALGGNALADSEALYDGQ